MGATISSSGSWHREANDGDQSRPEPRLKRGQHPTFGQGTVADVSSTGPNTRVLVDFVKSGRKTLILECARLTIVG